MTFLRAGRLLLVCLLSATFICACVTTSQAITNEFALTDTNSPPLVLAWSTQLASPDVAVGLNDLLPTALPVFTALLTADSGERTLMGVGLLDGRPLWNTTGVKFTIKGDTYTLPYVNAAWLRSDAIVADGWLKTRLQVRGFSLLNPKTGQVMEHQWLDPVAYSYTASLYGWGYLYVVDWNGDNRTSTVLRLAAPDFDPDNPATKLSFARPNSAGSSSGLYPVLRGFLLHEYSVDGRSRTLQSLNPTTLAPSWKIEGLEASAFLAVNYPVADTIVTSRTTDDPAITELLGFALTDGRQRFNWRVQWHYAPGPVRLVFRGTAWDKSSGNTRMCTQQTTWFTDNQQGAQSWLTCTDPESYKTTLNVTLKTAGQTSANSTFVVVYERWALLKDERTGSLMAFDCFTDSSAPSWTMSDQGDLEKVSVSDDGSSFIIAVYRSRRIAKWNKRA